ncbi:MAG: 2-dehydropantoate 2-reductase [Paludibacter sp.]
MKTKIVIVGLGGVGGYYGGLLARQYAESPEVEIYFVVRGAHLKKVQEEGLTVITETGTFVVHPTLATDNVTEIGVADYVIMTTKSYDLEATIHQIKPCVGKHTVILPLLNGIDNAPRIRAILPETEVWEGCVYIVARLNAPGVVESSGNVHAFNFGSENETDERLVILEKLLKDAGIEAVLHKKIIPVIWKKFFFISSTASLTSYFNVGFYDLLTDEFRKNTLIKLLEELLLVANAEGAEMDGSIIDSITYRLEKLPRETTSSMHTDFKAGKNTELKTLTGIVVEFGKKYGIDTPTYEMVYEELLKKQKN